MKKIVIALVLAALLALALGTLAFADNGPHGGFTSTTDACASCHRAHTAQFGSDSLLVTASVDELCLSCHDGAGAYTNVENGVYMAGGTEGIPGRGLMGGGFVDTKMRTDWTGVANAFDATDPGFSPTTSTHTTEFTGTVYGYGFNNNASAVSGASMLLECTSCHTPHGNGGKDPAGVAQPSYRLLLYTPSGSVGFTATVTTWNSASYAGYWITDPAFVTTDAVMFGKWWYTPNFYGDVTAAADAVNDPTLNPDVYSTAPAGYTRTAAQWQTTAKPYKSFANGDYSVRPASARGTYRISAGTGASSSSYDTFLAGPYMKPAQSMTIAGAPGGLADGTYVQGSEWNYTTQRRDMSYFCAQCHDRYMNNTVLRAGTTPSGDAVYTYRHSSGDYMLTGSGGQACMSCHVAHGTSADATALAASATLAGDSVLLRLDNRSLCLKCHASSVGFTVLAP